MGDCKHTYGLDFMCKKCDKYVGHLFKKTEPIEIKIDAKSQFQDGNKDYKYMGGKRV